MSHPVENVERMKSVCRQWGAPLFGVADLRPLKREDLNLSPGTIDRLPFGISIGFHLSDGVLEEIGTQPTMLYFHHYQRVNILLDTIGLLIVSAIQGLGYQAIPIAASQIVDWKAQKAHLSHKHVARLAGLGWIGRNNLLVTERFGSHVRLVTVMTDLPLETNSPLTVDCGPCRACLNVCPAGAIREKQEDFGHLQCYEQLRSFAKTLHFSHNICGICIKACKGFKRSRGQGAE